MSIERIFETLPNDFLTADCLHELTSGKNIILKILQNSKMIYPFK